MLSVKPQLCCWGFFVLVALAGFFVHGWWVLMRLRAFREAFWFLAACLFASFLVFDEEPVLDFTDFNLIHAALFTFAAVSVLAEQTLRARYGQHAYKDQTALVALLTFWFGLENYFRLVVLVFSWHCLMPLESELFELCEVYSYTSHWLTAEILPSFFAFLLAWACLILNGLSVGWARWQLILLQHALVTLGLLWACVCIAWDLVLAGLSALWADQAPLTYYTQSRTALTYDHQLQVGDRFDWHKDTHLPYAARFEDLFFFALQLFALVSLYCTLFVSLFLFLDLLRAPERSLSHTQLAILNVWFEHVCWAYLSIFLSFVWVGARVALRLPYEFWYV